jgi:hypothetical protein
MSEKVKIDLSAIDELEQDLGKFRNRVLYEVANRGRTLLQIEVPKQKTNLEKGVSTPAFNYAEGKATLTVSAMRARRGSRAATLHLKSGKTKAIQLRGIDEFDYAEAVARGRAAIRAKSAKVLIIPVSTAPNDEPYIVADGQMYVVRRSAKATKANPYDERAAIKLQGETVRIVEAVKRIVFK